MEKTHSAKTQSSKTRKIAAISAGTLVVGLGLTYTLATWTDSEWVWGSADGDSGIGTSTFNVQQNTFNPDVWADREERPGGALIFDIEPMALTPDTTIYAPVSLRTVEDSMAGEVQLQAAADPEDQSNALWEAVTLSVWTMQDDAASPTCDATTATDPDWGAPIIDDAPLATAASATQLLDGSVEGAPGTPQNYCFAITLPASAAGNQALQGLEIAPAWQFAAESVTQP